MVVIGLRHRHNEYHRDCTKQCECQGYLHQGFEQNHGPDCLECS
jgi:hypothetical protein